MHNARSLVVETITEEVAALGESWPLLRAGAFEGSVAAIGRAQAHLRRHLAHRYH